MATRATLKAQPRDGTGKTVTRKMRAAGRVPAVVYGHGEETRLVSVDAHELDLLFKRVHWENTLIEIDIEGEQSAVRTLVKEVQAHAHRPFIFHVDFQQIHAGETLTAFYDLTDELTLTLEEPPVEAPFEAPDLLAHRRLRQKQLLCRTGETAVPCKCRKRQQLPAIQQVAHGIAPSFMKIIERFDSS